jgi:hypothetical protein
MKKDTQMNLPSNQEKAWIQFLLASDNSIMRDAGETLAVSTGKLLGEETEAVPLEQKSPKEWEQALLMAECLKFSSNDNLVELSRFIYEWFAVAFNTELSSRTE